MIGPSYEVNLETSAVISNPKYAGSVVVEYLVNQTGPLTSEFSGMLPPETALLRSGQTQEPTTRHMTRSQTSPGQILPPLRKKHLLRSQVIGLKSNGKSRS